MPFRQLMTLKFRVFILYLIIQSYTKMKKNVSLKSLVVIAFITLTLPSLMSCKKENRYRNGIIMYIGNTENSGCGWVVNISEIHHKARNLPEKYKVDRMDVRIKYEYYPNRVGCQRNPDVFDEINIIDIR
jgi:hypothetical protein